MSDTDPHYRALPLLRLKCLPACLLACILCVGITYYLCRPGRQPPVPVMIGFPLQAEVTYFDEARAESAFHHGRRKFAFQNRSLDKAMKIRLPALAVYLEVQPNNFHKLEDRQQWPEFARNDSAVTLPPNRSHVFEEPYEMLGSGAAGWCFVFGPEDGVEGSSDEIYVGCVVVPGRREETETAPVTDAPAPN